MHTCLPDDYWLLHPFNDASHVLQLFEYSCEGSWHLSTTVIDHDIYTPESQITMSAVEALLASPLMHPQSGTLKSICLDNCTGLDDALIAEASTKWPYKYTGDTMPD